MAALARSHAEPAAAPHAPHSGSRRSPGRATARLRPVDRTRAQVRDRAGGGVASPQRPAAATPGPSADETGGANGAAVRVLARSVATPGTDRALARRTDPPAAAVAPPASATTDAARLAAVSGGALVAAPDGRASVVFASAGRQPTGSARATTTEPARGPFPGPAPAAASIDVDDLYDQIAARLRRELLLDRERAGELP
jgi:hypothetical protein